MRRLVLLSAFALSLPFPSWSQTALPAHIFFRVTLAASAPKPLDGRLLIFMKQGSGDKDVDSDPFAATAVWVAAREVHDLVPGASIEVDTSDIAFPQPFASMPVGDYEAQAVLDPTHTYNYAGRSPVDWVGPVVELKNWNPAFGAHPALTLTGRAVGDPRRTAAVAKAEAQATPGAVEKVVHQSKVLTQFWGVPTSVQAWVVLPPGYAEHPKERYPTAYWTHGFEGDIDYALVEGLAIRKRMVDGTMPLMIWVMLDESCAQGTHEFADSVNDGPWGTALTTEFLPFVEQRFRMDGKPTGRLLNGHSSGGWATLQLQVNYPQIFGGTWSTSPDPSDFHDFTNVDLYAASANMYRLPSGEAVPIMRDHGKVVATMEQLARLEAVVGPAGGQMASFDWVFSPRSASGAPMPMFDRTTGIVDPEVVKYWHDHYDLAHIVETTWAQRGALLKGRIHLIVGTADTFYLDGSAHKFEARLAKLHAEPHFTYIPDKTHFDLYDEGKTRNVLFDRIGAEMYAVARPGVEWKKK